MKKTARRFISSLKIGIPIPDLQLYLLDKDSNEEDVWKTFEEIGHHAVGILSEAGAPGIADPGSVAIKIAHELGISVQPLIGPSSILLALMASGMSGQSFAFHGYLPIKEKEANQSNTKTGK